MSEPVSSSFILLSPGSPAKLQNLGRTSPAQAEKEFLITGLAAPYTLDDLATEQMFTLEEVRDTANYVADFRSQPGLLYAYSYPSPKYPVDWNYSKYVEVRGWYSETGNANNVPFLPVIPGVVTPDPANLPPIRDWYYDSDHNDFVNTHPKDGNRMFGLANGLSAGAADYGRGEHRVTDLLISIPPAVLNDESHKQFFVWPLWARYKSTASPGEALGSLPSGTRPGYGYMGPGSGEGRFNEGSIIWDFTGKRFLERDDIVLQARLSGNFPAENFPRLVPVFNVGENYKATDEHGSPGLWNTGLPSWNNPGFMYPPFAGMTPLYYDRPLLPYANDFASASLRLFNYEFSQNDLTTNGTLEFFMKIDNKSGAAKDLLAGRLDIIPGTAIPGDWYRKVKPFSFGIHDITRQRAGVTILNNVINSANRERVFVDYRLNKAGRVTVQVFTLDGNLVKVLKQGHEAASPNYYRVSWDGTNTGGRSVARGMYFIRVVAPDIDEIRKVMVVR